MAYRYAEDKDKLLARLRRVEGQVRGIQRMIEEDTYCVDVLTQIQAIVSALDKVGLRLLEDHIRGCVADAVQAGEPDDTIAELMGVLERFMKARPRPVAADDLPAEQPAV